MEPKVMEVWMVGSDDFPEFQVGGFLGELSTVTFSGGVQDPSIVPSRKLTCPISEKVITDSKMAAATWMSQEVCKW